MHWIMPRSFGDISPYSWPRKCALIKPRSKLMKTQHQLIARYVNTHILLKISHVAFCTETTFIAKYLSLDSKYEEKSVAIITLAITFNRGFMVTI